MEFNGSKYGLERKKPEELEKDPNETEGDRMDRAKEARENAEEEEQRFKKKLKCKACHKTLKAKKKEASKRGKRGKKEKNVEEEQAEEDSDEMQVFYDDYGTEMKRLKKVKYSSRIARNLLRHLEFKHVCGDDGEEMILSYEDFVRHSRFACSNVREFKCLQPGCECPDKAMSKKELEIHLVTECSGVQVFCMNCKVSLSRKEFYEHDCGNSQLKQLENLRRLKEE